MMFLMVETVTVKKHSLSKRRRMTLEQNKTSPSIPEYKYIFPDLLICLMRFWPNLHFVLKLILCVRI